MKRLLIVDDSKLMRDMVAACLRPLGAVAFEFAGSGLEAIERLALAGFDLVVLDLNMPDVGGLEVIEFVRAQDRLRALPILVVTTRGDDDIRTACSRPARRASSRSRSRRSRSSTRRAGSLPSKHAAA